VHAVKGHLFFYDEPKKTVRHGQNLEIVTHSNDTEGFRNLLAVQLIFGWLSLGRGLIAAMERRAA